MKLLWLSIAGMMGTLARYGLAQLLNSPRGAQSGSLPWGTFAANLIGCFLMGVVASLALERLPNQELRLYAGVGFLGAFTTLSALELESFELASSGAGLAAAMYLTFSVGGGLLALMVGRGVGIYFSKFG